MHRHSLLAAIAVTSLSGTALAQHRDSRDATSTFTFAAVGGYGDSIVRPYTGTNYRGWGGGLRVGFGEATPGIYFGILVGASTSVTRGVETGSTMWNFAGEFGYDFQHRSGLIARPYMTWGAASAMTPQSGGWVGVIGGGVTVQYPLGPSAFTGADIHLVAAAVPGIGVVADVVAGGLIGFNVPFLGS